MEQAVELSRTGKDPYARFRLLLVSRHAIAELKRSAEAGDGACSLYLKTLAEDLR